MIDNSQIKTYLRDLFYLEEDVLNLLKKTQIPKNQKNIVSDNINEKQVIITKIIHLLDKQSPYEKN